MSSNLEWRRAKRVRSGSRRWISRCGRYMIAASEFCYGIKLDPVWFTVFALYDRLRRQLPLH